MTRPPLTANGIEILARLRAGQSPEHIAAVARDWGHRDPETLHDYRNSGRKPMPREHGTVRGWWQHKYRGESNCDACKAARRVHERKPEKEAS